MDLSSEKVFDDDKESSTFTSGNDKPVSSLGSTRVTTPDGQKKKRPGNSNQVKTHKIVTGQILIDETGEEAEQFEK